MISAARGHFSESHADCSGPFEQSVPLGQDSPLVPAYPRKLLEYLFMMLMALLAYVWLPVMYHNRACTYAALESLSASWHPLLGFELAPHWLIPPGHGPCTV